LDLGIQGDREELQYFRSALVLASRLAGIAAPVDGVTTTIDDAAKIRADTDHGRRMGFGGKLCIHPRQITAVHAAFAPSPDEVLWARRVLAAVRDAGRSVVALDGKMIDLPVILQAELVLARTSGPA
jgi:citrate lyase subunit beta/citryl-CoA lyase